MLHFFFFFLFFPSMGYPLGATPAALLMPVPWLAPTATVRRVIIKPERVPLQKRLVSAQASSLTTVSSPLLYRYIAGGRPTWFVTAPMGGHRLHTDSRPALIRSLSARGLSWGGLSRQVLPIYVPHDGQSRLNSD